MSETAQNELILRDLIESITCQPEQIRLEVKERPARVYWKLRASADDTPRLVGTNGAHVKALSFLISELGKAADKPYDFTLEDPEPGPVSHERLKKVAEEYDELPTLNLLERLLDALGVGEYHIDHAKTGVHADGRIENQFTIYVRSDEDYRILTVPPTLDRDRPTVIGALGALFRAAANKQGIRIQLQVEKVG